MFERLPSYSQSGYIKQQRIHVVGHAVIANFQLYDADRETAYNDCSRLSNRAIFSYIYDNLTDFHRWFKLDAYNK